MALVHLSSQKRIKDLFMMNNECAMDVFVQLQQPTLIDPSMMLEWIVEGSKSILGYIVDKVENN